MMLCKIVEAWGKLLTVLKQMQEQSVLYPFAFPEIIVG